MTTTVTADAPGAGTPAGTVTLDYGDGTPPVTQTLAAGAVTATHAYADTTGSPYTITATYGGDASFAGDTATVTQVSSEGLAPFNSSRSAARRTRRRPAGLPAGRRRVRCEVPLFAGRSSERPAAVRPEWRAVPRQGRSPVGPHL